MPVILPTTKPVEIFYSYSHKDEALREELEIHLSLLRRQRIITNWHDRNIHAGTEWAEAIDIHLSTAQIILLLVSPDFLASDYCYSIEMARAIARHEAGEAYVVPILLRSALWEGSPFSKLQMIPRDNKPIMSNRWFSRDEAWLNVVEELKVVIAKVASAKHVSQTVPASQVWSVPQRRNPFFTGREDLLKKLHDALHTNKATALTQAQAISGLGGIGKTQTALEYASRYRHEYRYVLWVSAATVAAILADFVKLADVLGLSEQNLQDPSKIVIAVKTWLAKQQDWLLILDNADNLEMVSDYFPDGSATNGHILLTTRAQSTGSLAHTIQIEEMGEEDGTLLLLRRAKVLSSEATLDQATPKARSDAESVVALLGGLPLALDQAGAYIEETGCSLSGYQDLYKKRTKELLEWRGRMPAGHPEPVATTWSLSFQLVEQANPAAAELLCLCAFLDPDAIPEELLIKGSSYLGPALEAIVSDPFALNKTLAELRKFSLIRRNADAKLLSLHRLIQAVLKERMGEEAQRMWAERALRAVAYAFPGVDTVMRHTYQPYLPQVQACVMILDAYNFAIPETATLLSQAAYFLYYYAYYKEAEQLYQRALVIREHRLGAEHPDTATSLHYLADLRWVQGRHEEAEALYKRSLAVREQVLGMEHPDTAAILSDLAMLYRVRGEHEEAESFHKRALAIRERALGIEHPNTATSLNNLGVLYQDRGRHEEAELFHKKALAIRERVLGEHPDTATSLNNLGVLYQDRGKYEEAELFHKRALAIYERILGVEHPTTSISLCYLARLYHSQSKYEQAGPLYQRAISIDEKAFGPEHPKVATGLENYAVILIRMGQVAEALTLLARAKVIRIKQKKN